MRGFDSLISGIQPVIIAVITPLSVLILAGKVFPGNGMAAAAAAEGGDSGGSTGMGITADLSNLK
jgi:hypothetical protein